MIGLSNPYKYKMHDFNIDIDDNFDNTYGITEDLKLALDI